MSESVSQMWEEYRAIVLPRDAGSVQIRETRRAFHAGGYAMLLSILNILENAADEDQAFKELMEKRTECLFFAMFVEQGIM